MIFFTLAARLTRSHIHLGTGPSPTSLLHSSLTSPASRASTSVCTSGRRYPDIQYLSSAFQGLQHSAVGLSCRCSSAIARFRPVHGAGKRHRMVDTSRQRHRLAACGSSASISKPLSTTTLRGPSIGHQARALGPGMQQRVS